MAQPIPLNLSARDPRAELQLRLQNAPLDHAEALLSAYEVLQGLHDRGVFELARGALGSSDKVLGIIVEAAKAPESIRGMRNLIIVSKIFGSIEPEFLEGFARALPEAIALIKEHDARPQGFWAIFKKFTSKSSRRALFFAASLLEAFGRNLPRENDGAVPKS
jgi:uncharacterized protein YjgD (DUF1641 family)